MATYAVEGVGFSLEINGVPFDPDLKEFTMPERVRESLETTHLGTLLDKTYKPARLRDPGEWAFVFDYDIFKDYLNDGVVRTFRLVFPLSGVEVTAGFIDFSGFVMKDGGQEGKVDTLLNNSITVKQSGTETKQDPLLV